LTLSHQDGGVVEGFQALIPKVASLDFTADSVTIEGITNSFLASAPPIR